MTLQSGARPDAARAVRSAGPGGRWLVVPAVIIALVLSVPVVTVLFSVFQESQGAWRSMAETVLWEFIANSMLLMVFVGLGVFVVGVGCAWLVTMCTFPGKRILEWALILPLAFPAYVLAYAYTDFLQHPGPVQTLLRDVTGWGPRDYWFPNIRSLEGAITMFVLVLYPYVYLLTRAVFLHHSVAAFEVSRTLGRSAWGAFFKVALPMARPAIVIGVTLALMETLADFGTVAHFAVRTFTTGIYSAWFAMGDRIAAAQLSATLLAFVVVLIVLERWQRGQARYHEAGRQMGELPQFRLTGWRAAGALGFCGVPLFLGFILPVMILVSLALKGGHDPFSERYLRLIWNSLTLAGTAAVLAVGLALVIAYASRLSPGAITGFASRLVSLGYALPGSIVAVGILIPLASFDNAVDAWMEAMFGISTGLLVTGSIAALIFAYLVRFMAVALNTVDSALTKITGRMDEAARTLGSGPGGTLVRVHAPMLRASLLTAGLIVFVDVMKELPATLIMRPFNFDTLAVQAYRLASDERLTQAATPSLMIVAVGVLPVVILSRQIMRSRPGQVSAID